MKRFAMMAVLFAALVVTGATFVSTAQAASDPVWIQKQLAWTSGSFTKSFTAAQTDTAFFKLPTDIDWSALRQYTGVNNSITLTFVTSTAAANADSVHYTFQLGAGGVYPFTDYRNRTGAITNSAINARGGDAGLVFTGVIQANPTTATNELIAPWQDVRVKVQGDPNGALAGLKVFICYPSRQGSQ